MDELDFNTALQASPIDLDPLLGEIGGVADAGKHKTVESWTDRLITTLLEQKDIAGAIRVVAASTTWYPRDKAHKTVCKHRLEQIFQGDDEGLLLLASSGFDNVRLKASECLRRMTTLHGLEDDVKVYDKTWGFGMVKFVDMEARKVIVDFVDPPKPNHGMALSFAAENINIIDDTHLLARNYADPDGMAEMVKKDPAEVMRMAIRSFGSRPIPILQEHLVPAIVPESRWKRFWDVARKNLKEDPLVIMPAKRSEAIVLLAQAKSFDENWFEDFAEERDMYRILDQVQEYLEQQDREPPSEEQKAVLANRLGFCLKGSANRLKENAVKCLLFGSQIGLSAEDMEGSEFLERAFSRSATTENFDEFLAINTALHAKERRAFFTHMLEVKKEETLDLFEEAIHHVDYTTLNEMLDILMANEREDAASDQIRGRWNKWDLNVFQTYWLCKNLDRLESWKLGNTYELAQRCLANLELEHAGEANTVQNSLRDIFSKPDWLSSVFDPMDDRQRRGITEAVKKSTGWTQLDNNNVLGQIVKLYPEMQEIVSGRGADGETIFSRIQLLSYRTFADMQDQLQKIKEIELPQAAQDIATARAFGDLRENFEYHAAKEAQRQLGIRQETLARQLSSVTPTDFSGMSGEIVTVGGGVKIVYSNAREETYFILGEFDSDENLGIISCNSRMAKALVGSTVGDELMVPSEDGGEAAVTVTQVLDLPSTIVDWIGTESMITSSDD